MRAPLSWLREYADLPDVPATEVAAALIRAGLEVETVHAYGADVRGVIVGEVLSIEELTGFRKPIRYCMVDVGGRERGIVCGATNFAVGDRVPVALPGGMLPGGFAIGARQTYGHTSDGMICSARELGVGEDHDGILVLPPSTPLGADAVDLLHVRDDVLDIAVTPDRGYCFSMRGLAREAATAFGVAYRDPALIDPALAGGAPVDGGARDAAGPGVRVEDPAGCDRYVAYGLAGLDPSARTPLELQRRLTLAGMRPISAAVDVTNYVLLDVGQPLHAFDRARVTGSLVVRRAAPGERLVTLDGQDRRLDPEDLVIADDSGAIAIAGVMGGAGTEVTAATTELVIESARFDPVSVARTARRHKLPSEASRRFERVVDPELAPAAAVLAARLLGSIAGARPAGVTSVGSPPARPVIVMGVGLPGQVAGYPIAPPAVAARLADVGCAVADPTADPLSVEPPSWRPDLVEPIDLVEEVVRLEGYDNVPEVLPPAPPGRGLTLGQRRRRAVSRAVAAAGYVEVLTYPFLADGVLDALGLEPGDPRRTTLSLVNPLADDAAALRTTLLPGLLGALARNLSRGATDLALYEEGLVFLPDPDPAARVAPAVPVDAKPAADVLAALDAALPDQPRRLAAVLAGAREAPGWWGQGRSVSWADAVEVARTAAGAVALTLAATPARVAPWHPGRCAQLQVGGTVVGHAGELHPRVIAALELPARTGAMELDLDVLLAAAPAVVPAPPISTYPVATSDVALVVGPGVPAAHVEAALREGAGPLLESIRLFDDYRGSSVGAGARSLAYALRLRAPDRTLTAEEVNAARDAAVAAAGRLTGATLRGA